MSRSTLKDLTALSLSMSGCIFLLQGSPMDTRCSGLPILVPANHLCMCEGVGERTPQHLSTTPGPLQGTGLCATSPPIMAWEVAEQNTSQEVAKAPPPPQLPVLMLSHTTPPGTPRLRFPHSPLQGSFATSEL